MYDTHINSRKVDVLGNHNFYKKSCCKLQHLEDQNKLASEQ